MICEHKNWNPKITQCLDYTIKHNLFRQILELSEPRPGELDERGLRAMIANGLPASKKFKQVQHNIKSL